MEQHSVEIKFGVAEVLWVRSDGTFHRKTYCQENKDDFLAEVIGAEEYLSELHWN